MSLLTATIILGAALFTSFVSSIFGMLGGLLLMAVLITLMSTGPAMVLHGLIQFASNGYRAFLNRQNIQWCIIGAFLIGAVAALAMLVFISFVPDEATVLIALGALPFIAAGLPKNLSLDISRPYMPIFAGLVIVPVNMLAGVGGPLLDVFFPARCADAPPGRGYQGSDTGAGAYNQNHLFRSAGKRHSKLATRALTAGCRCGHGNRHYAWQACAGQADR